MLKINRTGLQLKSSMHISVFMLLCLCVFSGSLIAKPLPLITVEPVKKTESLENFKTTKKTELLILVKELQVQAQIVAKDYFYIAQGLREEKVRININKTVREIDDILKVLSASIQDKEVQNLLSYLNEINMESKTVFNSGFSDENASLVIDYSETIYEGAQSIIEHLMKKVKNESSIFSDICQQKLALQRINKFYIAYQAGFNDKTMLDRLEQSVKMFEDGLVTISAHKFINNEQEFAFVRLKNSWDISKKYYEGMEKGELTLIVSVFTDHMMTYMDKIISLEKKA